MNKRVLAVIFLSTHDCQVALGPSKGRGQDECGGGEHVTRSISEATVQRAINPTPQVAVPKVRRSRMVIAARMFAVAMLVSGAACQAAAIASDEYDMYLMVGMVGFYIISGMAVMLLCINRMISSREEYYRQGQLEGWVRGWNGQTPDARTPGFE